MSGEVVLGHWWNGQWGRLGRIDVWFKRFDDDTGPEPRAWWCTEARRGGDGGRVIASPDYTREDDARALLQQALVDESWWTVIPVNRRPVRAASS